MLKAQEDLLIVQLLQNAGCVSFIIIIIINIIIIIANCVDFTLLTLWSVSQSLYILVPTRQLIKKLMVGWTCAQATVLFCFCFCLFFIYLLINE